ncbi:hypothetical protein WMF38_29745 [Sorangium sp. So ce118]
MKRAGHVSGWFLAVTLTVGCVAEREEPWLIEEGVADARQELTSGVYQVPVSIWPASSEIVYEFLSSEIPSYTGPESWWFCGHAAVATAINHLRNSNGPPKSGQIAQLEWFHQELVALPQPGYSRDPHRQASIDALKDIMVSEKGVEFETRKVATWSRETAKAEMASALTAGNYVVALGLTGGGIGHFYTVYKIDYDATDGVHGGHVYYSDVLTDDFDSMGFKEFLDGMRDAGTVGQYSFLKIRKR